MGATLATTLMIGDSPSDLHAAQQAGVSFLGYARNDSQAHLLRQAGADFVVASLEPVLDILRHS